jgi:hypothetical protein
MTICVIVFVELVALKCSSVACGQRKFVRN